MRLADKDVERINGAGTERPVPKEDTMSQPIERIPTYGTEENASYDALFQRVQNSGQGRGLVPQQQRDDAAFSREVEKRGDELNLSPEAQAQLRKLQQRDREVRAHESAHLAAAGQHAVGGAQYQYQKGPDGRMYAIGGHVSIDTSSVPGDPEETERKAEQVRRAALAPGEPSAQDTQVAAQAARMSAEARVEQRTNPEESGDGQNVSAADSYASVGSFFADETSGVGPSGSAYGAVNTANEAAASGGNPLSSIGRALRSYAVSAMQGIMPTGLAPAGTGISLRV